MLWRLKNNEYQYYKKLHDSDEVSFESLKCIARNKMEGLNLEMELCKSVHSDLWGLL